LVCDRMLHAQRPRHDYGLILPPVPVKTETDPFKAVLTLILQGFKPFLGPPMNCLFIAPLLKKSLKVSLKVFEQVGTCCLSRNDSA